MTRRTSTTPCYTGPMPRPGTAPESAIETRLTRRVRQAGGISVKITPVVAGFPDRLLLLPGGRHFLVELKAEDGAVDEIQRHWHARASAIGHPVHVVRGRQGVDDWCDRHLGDDVPAPPGTG